jgi:hypothetical protein
MPTQPIQVRFSYRLTGDGPAFRSPIDASKSATASGLVANSVLQQCR